ncbi:peptidyl-tRNA hydrolase, PTH1 family [Thiohalospira halophila DSM 15071]|uniref:Peptidyl-tRNA hydrolase n=1 Tax=Thiohalospira halophila DSM 15071 TaxID=1123397 RepID=A0A1I1TKS6_9GAMM|nr:aminoacyl-tRNA hydrolase [Thiohalospira halophila]SFD59117.1 peptidyl-tRNA hydrolase, PTH1 family [Thiohalospira halophila DSM 15071]
MALALIAGLGNPGDRYAGTRHNAGYWFADAVVAALGGAFKREAKHSADVARISVAGQDLRVAKPTTYMNHSGQAVGALARFYRLAPESVLVAHDELDLPAGAVRLKTGGGHGGHNGLRDIIGALGSRDFHRLRLGVGHPGTGGDVVRYVLDRPGKAERRAIDEAVEAAVGELEAMVTGDFANTMNRLHTT